MSLRVSTTSIDVFLKDLGINLVHPTIDHDLTQQFTAIELKDSQDLTTAIQSGILSVDDGSDFIHKDDYDPDEFLIQQLGIRDDNLYISHDELKALPQQIFITPGVFPLAANSTAAVTRNIYSPAARWKTWALAVDDVVELSNNTVSGIYTVESITDQQNFIIKENIGNSTGGDIKVYHPTGAIRIGINNTTLDFTNGINLQQALEDIDANFLTTSGISVGTHRDIDQLVHIIAEDSFEEYTYTGNKVINATVWTNNSKTTKIREEQFFYSLNKVTTLITIQYDSNGIENERTTETYSYTGNKVQNINRVLI